MYQTMPASTSRLRLQTRQRPRTRVTDPAVQFAAVLLVVFIAGSPCAPVSSASSRDSDADCPSFSNPVTCGNVSAHPGVECAWCGSIAACVLAGNTTYMNCPCADRSRSCAECLQPSAASECKFCGTERVCAPLTATLPCTHADWLVGGQGQGRASCEFVAGCEQLDSASCQLPNDDTALWLAVAGLPTRL